MAKTKAKTKTKAAPPKPPRHRPRQQPLPSTADETRVTELDDAISEAYDATEEWRRAGDVMRDLRSKVQVAMRTAGLSRYRTEDGIVAELLVSAERVKFKRSKGDNDDVAFGDEGDW